MQDTPELLIAYSKEQFRICPMPQFWNVMSNLLPPRIIGNSTEKSPPPLILAAWHAAWAYKMSKGLPAGSDNCDLTSVTKIQFKNFNLYIFLTTDTLIKSITLGQQERICRISKLLSLARIVSMYQHLQLAFQQRPMETVRVQLNVQVVGRPFGLLSTKGK
jgi:hypothetical protein